MAREQLPDLQTFSIGFDVDGFSELDRARATADALGVRNEACVVTLEEFLTHLPQILWRLDDPFGDASAVPLWFLARQARTRVTVALSGEGADELFGGYHVTGVRRPRPCGCRGRLPAAAPLLRRVGARLPATSEWAALCRSPGAPLTPGTRGADEVFDRTRSTAWCLGPGEPDDDLRATLAAARAAGLGRWARCRPSTSSTGCRATSCTRPTGCRRRTASKCACRSSTGSSHPSPRLCPLREDRGGNDETRVARAAASLLPAAIAQRPKLGFPVPVRVCAPGRARRVRRDGVREAEIDRYLSSRTARDLLDGYRAGRSGDWRPVWVLLCFALWHQIYVEGRFDPVALGWLTSGQSSDGERIHAPA